MYTGIGLQLETKKRGFSGFTVRALGIHGKGTVAKNSFEELFSGKF